MPTHVRLVSMPDETAFAPLATLGYCLSRTEFFAPLWREFHLPLKTVVHAPEAKVLDVLVSILAGCRALSQVNTRLRPDVALARAWQRTDFADQSTLARTLEAFDACHVAQFRQGSEQLFRRESLTLRHDFGRTWLWLDIDLSPLPSSKRAEASTKGKFGKKTDMGVNSHASMRHSIMRPYFHNCIRAGRKVAQPICPLCERWKRSWL